jgi:hypothetical protein
MQEHKIRQEIYHRIHREHSDDLAKQDIVLNDDVIGTAVDYFQRRDLGWIYPGKSYMVAICYARWLSEHWGGNPIEYLLDTELLYGNDPYYVPYSVDTDIYDCILTAIGGWDFDQTGGFVPEVHQYWREEFMIEERHD